MVGNPAGPACSAAGVLSSAEEASGGDPGRDRELPRWGLLLGYGLVIELVQWPLPYREFSWLDLVANVVGVLLYIGLRAWVGWRLRRPRVPSRSRP